MSLFLHVVPSFPLVQMRPFHKWTFEGFITYTSRSYKLTYLTRNSKMSSLNYIPSKTTEFFTKMNKIWSIAGLYNLWIIDEYNNKTLKFIHKIITFSIYIFIFTEYLASLTQPQLTEKQSKDLLLFVLCHPIFMSYYVGLVYHKKKVKDLLIMLNITLKEIYNDPDVEKRMIRRATIFSITYQLSICVSVFSYGFDGLMQVLRSGHCQIVIAVVLKLLTLI